MLEKLGHGTILYTTVLHRKGILLSSVQQTLKVRGESGWSCSGGGTAGKRLELNLCNELENKTGSSVWKTDDAFGRNISAGKGIVYRDSSPH